MPPGNTSPWQHEPTQKRHFNKKKRIRSKRHHRNSNSHPNHNVLLHRLNSPPSGKLLERIGGAMGGNGVVSTLPAFDAIDGGISEVLNPQHADSCSYLTFSVTKHLHTPDPGEAERFLQSVIGVPSAPSLPPNTGHAFAGNDPFSAPESHILFTDHRPVKVEDTSSSVLPSPTQTVNSLPSSLTLGQSPPMNDRTPSPSTIKRCKQLLVPVVLASIHARNPAERLDSEQCLRLLSDDHCKDLIRIADKMKWQLSSVLSQETPIYQELSGSLKRDRVHGVGAWVRNTRTRFDSANSVASDASRRDNDATLVDALAGGRQPPKAPRAMLQASNLSDLGSTHDVSPTIEDDPLSLVDLLQNILERFPALQPTKAEIDTTNASEGQPAALSAQMLSPILTAPPISADFVSHLPTQPGTWFRQRGREFADIVDVGIEVSDDMFYLSRERQPSRVRMSLHLCSVPMGAMMDTDDGHTAPVLPNVIDDAIAHHAFQWPQKGKLVVQVNPEFERHKTWLPHALELDPVDVTACVRPGKNVFRFIQLSDLSQFTFVLVASLPPPEEAWRSWDWASLADSLTQSVDDPANNLSEFARIRQGIQVIVRS